MTEIGKWLLFAGLLLCVLGGFFLLIGKTGIFGWFGRLPGDIHWQGKSVEVYVPWVSMLLVSLLLSLVLQLVSFFRR